MATSKQVARSLKKTATQLAKIPDDVIRLGAQEIVEEAITVGGTFTRRRYPLFAEAKVRGGKKSRSAVVFGRPAGFWVIKTFGRDGMRVKRTQRGSKRLKGFRIGGGYATSAGPAGPQRRGWNDVAEFAADRLPELVGEQIDEVI